MKYAIHFVHFTNKFHMPSKWLTVFTDREDLWEKIQSIVRTWPIIQRTPRGLLQSIAVLTVMATDLLGPYKFTPGRSCIYQRQTWALSSTPIYVIGTLISCSDSLLRACPRHDEHCSRDRWRNRIRSRTLDLKRPIALGKSAALTNRRFWQVSSLTLYSGATCDLC
jgi:hypothetical protein